MPMALHAGDGFIRWLMRRGRPLAVARKNIRSGCSPSAATPSPSTLKRMDLSAPSATPTALEVLSASAALPAARRILGRSPSDEIDMVDSAPAPAGPAANQPAAAMELTSTGLRCAAAAGSRAIEGIIIIDGER